jgi:hypothetical protein
MGKRTTHFSNNGEEAEWDATGRIGEEMPIRMNPKLQSAERMKKLKDERAGIETSAGPYPDANGWSEADIDDLKAALLAYGSSLQATAQFICRSGTVDDVAAKAKETGAEVEEQSKQQQRKIAN